MPGDDAGPAKRHVCRLDNTVIREDKGMNLLGFLAVLGIYLSIVLNIIASGSA